MKYVPGYVANYHNQDGNTGPIASLDKGGRDRPPGCRDEPFFYGDGDGPCHTRNIVFFIVHQRRVYGMSDLGRCTGMYGTMDLGHQGDRDLSSYYGYISTFFAQDRTSNNYATTACSLITGLTQTACLPG
eukprot:scaffold421253_cov59-Attheya_sp.AAC.3